MLSQYDNEISNYVNDLDKKIFDELKKPHYENKILLYKNELLLNAQTIPFHKRYKYRPDRISYEYLELLSGAWVIMILNNVSSVFDFIPERLHDEIVIPNKFSLEKIFE